MKTHPHTMFVLALLCAIGHTLPAHAEDPSPTRFSAVFGVPGLSFQAGDATSFGVFGFGMNVRTAKGLYLSTYLALMTALTDDIGYTFDATIGYNINLNNDRSLPWLSSLAPQMGYRMGLRPIYYRDGFGPINRTHGIIAGVSYDIYRNAPLGLVFRAHSLLDLAIGSRWEGDYGPEFDDDLFRFGMDIGLSVGISYKQ